MIGTYTIFRNYISAVFPEFSQLFDGISYEALLAKEGKMRAGPLSEKLYGIPAFEEFALLAPGLFESSQTAEEIEKIEAPNNGFVGTKIIWKNSSAPINKKIVAFGNSFFERGASPQGFSWWFKHSSLSFILFGVLKWTLTISRKSNLQRWFFKPLNAFSALYLSNEVTSHSGARGWREYSPDFSHTQRV